jgi:hypothetical protein
LEGAGEETGAETLEALPPRSGYRRRTARLGGRVLDAALDTRQALLRTAARIDGIEAELPRRRVALLGVYGAGGAATMSAAVERALACRHEVVVALGALDGTSPGLEQMTREERMGGGRLANLNRLATLADARAADWVLLLDDDVAVGERFLDRLLALGERFRLQLLQPALTHSSHTAWPITRRRPAVLRRTAFVEMGPVLMMDADAFSALAPFPEQGMGWGICLHWAAEARQRGWRIGIADAVPVRHDLRPPAASYDRGEARAAAAALLRGRAHIGWREADQVLDRYRSL